MEKLTLKQIHPTASQDLIYHGDRFIGTVTRGPVRMVSGMTSGPRIALSVPQTEQMVERIKNLVNKRDNTNCDFGVAKPPPRHDHPAIQNYLIRKYLR